MALRVVSIALPNNNEFPEISGKFPPQLNFWKIYNSAVKLVISAKL